MAKLSKISGFPEWLPEQKLVEDYVVGTVKRIYESHGFTPLETPSVELISTLTAQGVEDKELYVLQRLKAEPEAKAELGMHFDLTVPFARYVAQHMNNLVFPFKRYQCQRSWRGERPQKGRFREFYQFDADIVCRESLPLACDAEILMLLDKVYRTLNIGSYRLLVNNRKLLAGIYAHLGMAEAAQKSAIIAVDKLDKIGRDGVLKELQEQAGVVAEVAEQILSFTELRTHPAEFSEKVSSLGVSGDLFDQGVEELKQIFSLLPAQFCENIVVDLSLARGLGYYNGLIVEARLVDYPEFGSVGGGGRYEDLASQFSNKKLPGVGVSVGITRLMELIFDHDLLEPGKKTPSEVLISVYAEEDRPRLIEIAETLRGLGICCEVFPTSPQLGKQIDYGAKKDIPYVLFSESEGEMLHIKNIRTGEQVEVPDLADWCKGYLAERVSG
jgi:histidyl-tRNA synthetase